MGQYDDDYKQAYCYCFRFVIPVSKAPELD